MDRLVVFSSDEQGHEQGTCIGVIRNDGEKIHIVMTDGRSISFDREAHGKTFDFVDVIRCKHCAVERDLHGGCPMMGGTVPDDMFYCANGIRKETEDGKVD